MNEPIDLALSDTGKNLYLFFGGMNARIGMPPFEFYRASQILDEHKIFFRDQYQCWYQNGISIEHDDIVKVTSYITTQIEKIDPETVYFVGNSMGGYAAVLFSELTSQGKVIAFAPQTFICPELPRLYSDVRFPKLAAKVHAIGLSKPQIWDLRELLLKPRIDPLLKS